MVRCTVFAVPVRANPQIGFIVGVEILVIRSDFLQQAIGVIVFHLNRETEILPVGCILLELELHEVRLVVLVSTCQPSFWATVVICSIAVIASFFISLCSELFGPPQGWFLCAIPNGGSKNREQGTADEIL